MPPEALGTLEVAGAFPVDGIVVVEGVVGETVAREAKETENAAEFSGALDEEGDTMPARTAAVAAMRRLKSGR